MISIYQYNVPPKKRPIGKRKFRKDPFRDDQGFTSVAMVLSLLLSLALIFTGAQVYRVNSASAQVQEVADAAVLSSENQVAEFMVVTQFCDAVGLSMTLSALTSAGLGLVALCVPAAFPLADGLLDGAAKVMDARNHFSEKAASVLNKLQEALPFLCAACAASVAKANDGTSVGASYIAASILVPTNGKTIEIGSADEAQDFLDDLDEEADAIKTKAQEAEDAAKEANAAKERAFQRDCGDNPSYCMYERAGHLAAMNGTENPLYASVDTWTFSVALERARIYYSRRAAQEAPESFTVEAQAQSALRQVFYDFAVDAMKDAYVRETDDSFEANFPRLPHNTAQMRETSLYSQGIYPITAGPASEDEDEETPWVMHAWSGCPKAAGYGALGSIATMEAGNFVTCESCEFTAASLGKVAAASTAIDNGFEYHYEAVADEAEIYQKAMEKAYEPKRVVKAKTEGFFERLQKLWGKFASTRIEAEPPGRFGAVALVANLGSTDVSQGLGSGFVQASQPLGARAALSAATLVGEESSEGRTVLNSLLDGIRQDGGAVAGAAGIILDGWSSLLQAYGDGLGALTNAVREGLDSIPLVGASGLGTWVSKEFSGLLSDVGLQPADLKARKAVLVNSSYVASQGSGAVASGFVNLKQRVLAASSGATDVFSMVLNDAEREALSRISSMGPTVTIASIELLGPSGPSIPLTIPIPEKARSFLVSGVQGIFDRLRSLRAAPAEGRVWQ